MCKCKNTTNEEMTKLYEKIESLEEKLDTIIEEVDYINRNTVGNAWE